MIIFSLLLSNIQQGSDLGRIYLDSQFEGHNSEEGEAWPWAAPWGLCVAETPHSRREEKNKTEASVYISSRPLAALGP